MSLMNLKQSFLSGRFLSLFLLPLVLGAASTWSETYEFLASAPQHTDNDGIYSVAFYVNPTVGRFTGFYEAKNGGEQLLLTRAAGSGRRTLDLTPRSDGTYRYYQTYMVCTAINETVECRNETTMGLIVVVNSPEPIVTLTSPAANLDIHVNTTVSLAANASVAAGAINELVFKANQTVIATDTVPPFRTNWTPAAAGIYAITAVATDNNGGVTVSTARTVNVTVNSPPVVAIRSPVDNGSAPTNTPVVFSVDASDSDGVVTDVKFYADNVLIAANTAAPYQVTWNPASGGNYTLKAIATDDDGAVATASRQFVVLNRPPNVTLTAPVAGDAIAGNTLITLGAVASDSDGSVSQVEFRINNAVLGTDSMPPYATLWTPRALGDYNIEAVATDDSGDVATSGVLSVTITELAGSGAVVGALNGSRYAVYYGDLDGVGSRDIYFAGIDSAPPAGKAAGFVVYHSGSGYSQPLLLSLTEAQVAALTPAGNNDVLFADFNGDSYSDVLVRGATTDDPTLILAGTAGNGLPVILVEYSGPDQLEHHNLSDRSLVIALNDTNGDGLTDIVLVGGGLYGGDVTYLADADGIPNQGQVSGTGDWAASAAATVPDHTIAADPAPAHDAGLGALAATAGVAGGQASYQIPIQVPPGRNGIEPQLSVVYASGAGNGVLGMGWRLAAGSSISRCDKTVVHDGGRRRVQFDALHDRLCLDGRRLLVVSGTYGQSGAVYRTELDDFTRVTQSGALNDVTTSFTAELKNSRVRHYGATGDSRHSPQGVTPRLTWSISSEVDRNGNTMRYHYRDFAAGEHLLTDIYYTGTATAAGDRRVQLVYEDAVRPDPATRYLAGGLIRQSRRLEKIATYYQAGKVREYRFAYRLSGASKRSLLDSVRVCAYSAAIADCLPATTLSWQDAAPQFVVEKMGYRSPAAGNHIENGDQDLIALLQDGVSRRDKLKRELPRGDVNGDGVRDWANWYLNAEGEKTGDHNGTVQNCLYHWLEGREICLDGDFNVDGRSDHWRKSPTSNQLQLAYGADHAGNLQWFNTAVPFGDLDYLLNIGDFNGDGWPDIVVHDKYDFNSQGTPLKAAVRLFLHTGSKQSPYTGSSQLLYSYNWKYRHRPETTEVQFLGDMDGNGLPDFTVMQFAGRYVDNIFNVPQAVPQTLHLTRVNEAGAVYFDAVSLTAHLGLDASNSQGVFNLFVDVNADGLPDWVARRGPDHSKSTHLSLNRGGGHFGPWQDLGAGAQLASRMVPYYEAQDQGYAPSWVVKYGASIRIHDYDGDGRPELLVPGTRLVEACPEVNMGGRLERVCGEDLYGYFSVRPSGGPGGASYQVPIPAAELDHSLYRYDAIRFVERADGSFVAQRFATGLIAPGAAHRSAVLDAYGNGIDDLLFVYGCTWFSEDPSKEDCFSDNKTGVMATKDTGFYINRNRGSAAPGERYAAPDMLIAVENGQGLRDEWYYRPLSSQDDRYHTDAKPFYEPDFDYLQTLSPAARASHFHFTSSMYVVAEHRSDNGIGGLNRNQYRYKGAMYNNKGRGFQGFRTIIVEALERGTQTRSDFHQVFPLAGRHYRVRQWALDDREADTAFDDTYYRWRFWPGGGRSGPRDYTVEALTDIWEVEAGRPYFVGRVGRTEIKRTLEKTATARTELYRNIETGDFDEWGNLLLTDSRYLEPGNTHEVRRTEDMQYDPADESGWWLDKTLRRVTTHYAIAARNGVSAAGTDIEHSTTADYLAWDLASRQPIRVKTTPSSGKWTQVTTAYNGDGLPSSVTRQGQGETGRTTTTVYSADGYFPAKVTNPLGHTVETQFEPRHGQPNWVIDANGLITGMTYDSFGRAVVVEAPGVPGQFTSLLACDTACPDNAVYKVKSEQAGSPAVTAYLDRFDRTVRVETEAFAAGRILVRVMQYDRLGQLLFESVPRHDHASTHGVRYTGYDLRGRPTGKTLDKTDGRQLVIGYTHERGSRGFTTAITADGLAMSRSYNGLEQLIETVDAELGVTRYAYDGSGNPIVTEDAKGARIIVVHNALGQKVWLKDPNMGPRSFTYTGFGEIDIETDAAGQVTDFDYDILGRLVSRKVDGSTEATWQYDTAANGIGLPAVEQRVDQVFRKTYQYDILSRPSRVTTHIDGESFITATQYDSHYGRVKGLVYPNGLTLAYAYNDRGYGTRLSNAASGYVYREVTGLSAFGEWQSAALAGGAAFVDRDIDSATGQFGAMVLRNFVTVLHTLDYDYDVFGNPGRVTTEVPGFNPVANVETFAYDDLHRLTQSRRTGGPTIDYRYDAVGNMLAKTDYGTTYHYGDTRPNAVSTVDLVAGGSVSFGYDANGNRTHENGVQTLWYNAFNKPTTIVRGGTELQFSYGADQARYKQVNATTGTTTVYIDKLFERTTANGSVRNRYFIEDVAVLTSTVTTAGTTHDIGFTHRDRLGSPVAIINATGLLKESHSFDPFGKPRAGDGRDKYPPVLASSFTTHGFTDHEHLDAVQLIHMNGRGYDYNLGRFLSVDPFIQEPGNSQGLNPYSYIMNNPLAGTDPTGYLLRNIEWDDFILEDEELSKKVGSLEDVGSEDTSADGLSNGSSPVRNVNKEQRGTSNGESAFEIGSPSNRSHVEVSDGKTYEDEPLKAYNRFRGHTVAQKKQNIIKNDYLSWEEADQILASNNDPNLIVAVRADMLVVKQTSNFYVDPKTGEVRSGGVVMGIPEYLVHGQVTIKDRGNGTYGIYQQQYNFEQRPVNNFYDVVRNIEAFVGGVVSSEGTPFWIQFDGNANVIKK